MKASDYIVEYLISKGVTDVFGYPGGMVTHLMDSFSKYKDSITAHVTYHEQGAAFAACGYALSSGVTGVAYATSGPGATNLITGICHAYMDSIPTVFITGQVNSFEQRGNLNIRQRGFQETDIVSMVQGCTKYAARVNDASRLKYELDKAFFIANDGRKGPVLLDIAMDVTRAEILPHELQSYEEKFVKKGIDKKTLSLIQKEVDNSKRPTLLLGNGLNRSNLIFDLINKLNIPVVTSMLAVDFKSGLERCYGFVGAYGDRSANFVVAKSDLLITLGARLDVRQVGAVRENFAPNARIIRIDIDSGELIYSVHKEGELPVEADAELALKQLAEIIVKNNANYDKWIDICNKLKEKLYDMDCLRPNQFVRMISELIPEDSVITTDVGQNQVWVAQSLSVKSNQKLLFSGGHGAMGHSLPASIGAAVATRRRVFSFNGDGGIQMNIQELQTIVREKLPVKIVLFNNNALGMIRHFQEMYFSNNYYQTVNEGGYSSPDFQRIALAYGIDYARVDELEDVKSIKDLMQKDGPAFIEVFLNEDTYVFPKLEYGKPNQDQEPLVDRNLYKELMSL